MFTCSIDINENYFYMLFGPKLEVDIKEYGIVCISVGEYYQERTGTKWAKTLLCNTGWGQPYGYERLPSLPFESLMELALKSDHKTTKLKIIEEESNKYGAIAIIMERHKSELIDFLSINLSNKELFQNELYRHNLTLFCFDAREAKTNGGVGVQSYEDMLNQHTEWLLIASKVKELIYHKRAEVNTRSSSCIVPA